MKQDVEAIVMADYTCQKVVEALQSSFLETVIFMFGKVKAKKLITTDVLIPTNGDYESRGFSHVHVSPEFVAREFPEFLRQGKTLVATIHSHPRWLNEPSFPDIEETHRSVIRFYPHQLTGIYDHKSLNFFRMNGTSAKKVEFRVVNSKNLQRFQRQILLIDQEGQLLISSTNVLLIGVGGGNTLIAFALSCMGVNKLILIDPDRWEESNRNRVFIPPEHVGMYKVASVKKLIKEYFPEIEVEAFVSRAEDLPNEIYAQADIIVVGPDTVTTRIFGNRQALKHGKTAVFPAAGILAEKGLLKNIGGSVKVVIPNETPCYECMTDIDSMDLLKESLDPEKRKIMAEKYLLGDILDIPTAPSIIALNYQIAGIALWEIVKLITGIDKPIPFQVYSKGTLKPVNVVQKENCPACGAFRASEEIEDVKVEFEESGDLLDYLKKSEKIVKEGKNEEKR